MKLVSLKGSSYEKMSEKQVDSLIKIEKENFKSREDFFTQLENIKLTLALDEKIIQHFKNNESKFEQLKKRLEEIVCLFLNIRND